MPVLDQNFQPIRLDNEVPYRQFVDERLYLRWYPIVIDHNYGDIYYNGASLGEEIAETLRHARKRFVLLNGSIVSRISFECRQDAMLFKLVWRGGDVTTSY